MDNQYTRSIDIFAFGLCVLELTTKQRLDRDNAHSWPTLLDAVQDAEARGFIHRCSVDLEFLFANIVLCRMRLVWAAVVTIL